jgi:formylglycine-generating enzyme required for sulfatase activity
MERKRVVYVSSTFVDLEAHRAELRQILEKGGWDVSSMETYPAFDERPLDKCLADVAAADVYVLLIAHRYGYRPSTDNPGRLSITELEYEQAQAKRKTCLVFTVDPDHPWIQKWVDKGEDATSVEAFKARVEERHGVSRFTDPGQLTGLVLASLSSLASTTPAAERKRDTRHNMPAEPADIFLSYARKDQEKARQLAASLASHGWSVWWDRMIPPGSTFDRVIQQALETSRCVLVLWSSASVTSNWVKEEASEAQQLDKLVPALIEEVRIPLGFRRIQAANLTQWRLESTDDHFSELLGSLTARLGAPVVDFDDNTEAHYSTAPVYYRGPAPTDEKGFPLKKITATTCLLRQEADRWRLEHQQVEVEGFQEELAEGIALNMVKIPAGTFLMGSPPDEPKRSDAEGPQHEVTLLGAFFLSQTPITQAQWRAVALWEKVERDLKAEPSKFKGANRPVEQVSWWDAVEFCRRLSKRIGRFYGLPSESQWEYACRAGSITPFHFGATLTPELATYNGTKTYEGGPMGTVCEQTTDVASFPANSWGLQDMHGNVWEWCVDQRHPDYEGSPADGCAWTDQSEAEGGKRQLRGGCWNESPSRCRSAFRMSAAPECCINSVGFRVCCLPQGRLLPTESLDHLTLAV